MVSFQKYRIHIANDEWYRKSDILILSETRTITSNQPTLPGFKLIHQSDEDEAIGKRGILVFAKANVILNFINYDIKFSRTKPSHHSEIFLFKTSNTLIITGYKSPSTPAKTFKSQITSTMNIVQSSDSDKCIYIGDFNFDISEKATLSKFMDNFNMQSILNEITTNNNTQIDNVFANFQHVEAGAYESYFSDHKPIFCMIKYHLKTLQIKLDRIPIKPKLNSKLPPQIKLSPASPPKKQPRKITSASPPKLQPKNLSPISPSKPQPKKEKIPSIQSQTEHQQPRLKKQTVQPTIDDILEDITTARKPLTDMAIDWLIDNLINPDTQIAFKMIATVYKQRTYKYTKVAENKDDLQIIFSGHWSSLGHYILAHFVANENVVKIYDSLHGSGQHGHRLQSDEKDVLTRLYPGKKIVFVEPATKQSDGVSCGIFAIAYATTIILGDDPAIYKLQLLNTNDDQAMALREHIARMYRNRELAPFPQDEFINYDDLSTDAVHEFIKLFNDFNINPNMDQMIDVTCAAVKEMYARQTTNDDVQILYEGRIVRNENDYSIQNNIIGHYICIRYDSATNTVYVYDSSSFGQLDENSSEIINLRYNNPAIQHARVRTMQPDGLSCGVFAIANATTLIFGQDPAAVDYKIDCQNRNKSLTLRKHLSKMIQDKQLAMFPVA